MRLLSECHNLHPVPAKKREPVSHNVSARFRPAEVAVIEALAYEDDLSMGAWIRKQILKSLARRGKYPNGSPSQTT